MQGRRGEEGREKGIKVKGAGLYYLVLMGRISARFLHNRAFCEENTTLTECLDFYTSI